MPSTDQFLGTGIAFPLAPNGATSTVSGVDAVAQSIRTLLFTEPGERIGRPSFGCGLRRFLFAPNSVGTRTLIRESIKEAIERHAPRVELEDVFVRADPDARTVLRIEIRYRVATSPDPKSLVFPFYLDEA